MPPMAPMPGKMIFLLSDNSPSISSRLSSKPTKKKNTAKKEKIIVLKNATAKVGDYVIDKEWVFSKGSVPIKNAHRQLLKLEGMDPKKKKIICQKNGTRRVFYGLSLLAVKLKRNNFINRLRFNKTRIG